MPPVRPSETICEACLVSSENCSAELLPLPLLLSLLLLPPPLLLLLLLHMLLLPPLLLTCSSC